MFKPAWQTADLTDDLDVEWPDPEGSQDEEEDMSIDMNPPAAMLRVSPSATGSIAAPPPPEGHVRTPPGTFVVHHEGAAAPISAQSAVKSFFSPLKLETMFQPPPPSPAGENGSGTRAGVVNAVSNANPHRARKPSRLSQVHLPEPPTPSQTSFESAIRESPEQSRHQPQADQTRSEEYEEVEEEIESPSPLEDRPDEILETDIPHLGQFDGRLPSTSFRFKCSIPPRPRNPSPPSSSRPLPPDSSSSSPANPMATPTPVGDPRLRLFQLQYDTYTRAHLSAMVDSIGVESASPSAASSGQSSESSSAHVVKRIKLSPPSGENNACLTQPAEVIPPAAVVTRDYVRESAELMKAMRGTRTVSGSSGTQNTHTRTSTGSELGTHHHLVEQAPAVTSTSWRLAQSSQRNVEYQEPSVPQARRTDIPGPVIVGLTEASRESTQERPVLAMLPISAGPSLLPIPTSQADLNRYISSASAPTVRTVSSSSHNSQGTSGTLPSFTKHPGPPPSPPKPEKKTAEMRRIRPEDVAGVLPDKVGGMVFDRERSKWVKRRSLSLGEESGESKDVFGSIESFNEEGDIEGRTSTPLPVEDTSEDDAEDERTSSPPPPLVVLPSPATFPQGPSTPAPSLHEFPPAPPRSALKSTVFGGGTTPLTSERRSVSFSDGRKIGPILGLGRRTQLEGSQGNGYEEAVEEDSESDDEGGEEDEDDKSFLTSVGNSVRVNRIEGMLEALQELSIDDEDDAPDSASSDAVPTSPFNRRRHLSVQPSPSPHSGQLLVPLSLNRLNSCRLTGDTSISRTNATFLTECSFGVAHDKLVKYITDVHPFLPHWEDLSEIVLNGKGIESVARLKEFLPTLEDLNLDDNQIAWLTGLPATLRRLSIASNQLTGLTAYAHIRKLQYLNISHNQVDSVDQLSGLRNLRELHADYNIITSIDGLFDMPLIKLSLRGNAFNQLDVAQSSWTNMEHLDLSQTGLMELVGLHKLSALRCLNLEDNALSSFSLPSDHSLLHLRVLRLSGNRLSELCVTGLSSIRTLYADNNHLKSVEGLKTLRKLDNLSLRNQGGKLHLNLEEVRDVKRLYLSGNPLPSGFLSHPLYAVVYLELAACRLSTLPPLHDIIPNVRVLNLNYNFLTELDCFRGLDRLRKLTVVGSGFSSSRAMVDAVQELKELELLDLRMNPCTLRWYIPLFVSDPASALQPSEAGSGKRDGASRISPDSFNYIRLDKKHRRDLPDELYVARLTWRGLVMRYCPRIAVLDGLEVTGRERVKGDLLLKALHDKKAVKAARKVSERTI